MANQSASTQTALNPSTLTKAAPYVFDGWSLTSGMGQPLAYADQANYQFTESVTLYARFRVANSVIFFPKGGSGSMARQSSPVATALTLNAYVYPGFVFDGWRVERDDIGMAYADGATYPFTGDGAPVTLIAQWLATVTFNANGGSGSMANQFSSTNQFTNRLTLNQNTFTRAGSGYVFGGWATSSTRSKEYANGGAYKFTAPTTLYATWVCAPSVAIAIIKKRRSGQNSAIVTYQADSGESPWKTFTARTTEGMSASIDTSSNSESITVTGLQKGQFYFMTVTGTNEAGCSYTSAEVQVEKNPDGKRF